jgi:peptidyl-tRNA hydrolase, PTH2 family
MKPAMYIFLNKGLGMSAGKAAAQASHAAVEAYRLSLEGPPDGGNERWHSHLVNQWYKGGHYAKYVIQCRDSEHLRNTERYLNDRGFKTALVIDEGRTEVPPITPTALGVEIVDKDDSHVQATLSSFDLYTDPEPESRTVIAAFGTPACAAREREHLLRTGKPLWTQGGSVIQHIYGFPVTLRVHARDADLELQDFLAFNGVPYEAHIDADKFLDAVARYYKQTGHQ